MPLMDKLYKTLDTKERIRQAIINKGVPCATDCFSEYPSKIEAIQGGGGEPSEYQRFVDVPVNGSCVIKSSKLNMKIISFSVTSEDIIVTKDSEVN